MNERHYTLRRGFNLLLIAALLFILTVPVIRGTNRAVRDSLDDNHRATLEVIRNSSEGAVSHRESTQQTFELIVLIAYIVDGFVLGTLGAAALCAAVGVVFLATARSQQANIGTLDSLDKSLATIVSSIEAAARDVLAEARRKEADVLSLDQRVQELTAFASLTEDQAEAIRRRLTRGATVGIALGILGIVATIVVAVWQVIIQ